MITDGLIEASGIIILFACWIRCLQYFRRSHSKKTEAFWLAAVLVFFAVIRRELNYLPDLFIPTDFLLQSQPYDWWEDCVLTVVYLMIVGLLAYSWHYLLAVLKRVPISLYLTVAVLALLEYMGENMIGIPKTLGVVTEELSETAIYAIALIYLWRFTLSDYDCPSARADLSHSHAVSHSA
ncbi:MAG: hypothetical protein ACTH4C_02080 [Psychrobacter celer]